MDELKLLLSKGTANEFESSAELLAAVLSPRLLQDAIDRLDQALVCFAPDGRLICWNNRYRELLDLPAALLECYPNRSDVLDFLRSRGDFSNPNRFFDENGNTIKLDPASSEMPNRYWHRTPLGRVLEVSVARLEAGILVLTFTDITPYYVARREAEKNSAKLRRILEAFDPGTWELDLDTGKVEINHSWAKIIGYQHDEVVPMSREKWRSLICDEDVVQNDVAALAFFTGAARQFKSTFRMKHKEGHWVWVQCIGRNYDGVSENGSIVTSGTLVDVTDKVMAQSHTNTSLSMLRAEVEQRNLMLERSLKDLSIVSSSLAHDLRTPLRSINGFSSVLAEPDVCKNPILVAEYSQRIAEQSAKMGRMVSSMLDLLRIMGTPPASQPIRISEIVKAKVRELQPAGVVVDLRCADDPEIENDPGLIGIAIAEMVKNSIAYSKPGEPVSLELQFSEKDRVYTFKDEGIGFDVGSVNYLFKPFSQLNKTGKNCGLGMGLAIASKSIEKLGGRLWANSSPGRGAAFSFSFGATEGLPTSRDEMG